MPRLGFTLIEILVMVFILTLATGAVFALIALGFQTHGYASEQSQAIEEARRGVETMAKEIREAKTAENGAYLLEKAEDFEFVFYSDIDRDSLVERVRYFIFGTNFQKGVIEPTPLSSLADLPVRYLPERENVFILSRYVRNSPPIFHYFDGQGLELPSPARQKDTQLLRLTLVIDVNPQRPPQDFVLESEVQIRNLR